MLTYTLERKRKRHDLTPISKSQASSNLIKTIERSKGMFISYIYGVPRINVSTAPSTRNRRRKRKNRTTTNDSPTPTESSRELFRKRRRLMGKTSE